MRSSGDEFCSSYARVLAKHDRGTPSPLRSHRIGSYSQLRCATPDKLNPILAWCDEHFEGSDDQTAWEIAELLSSLANSSAPNFSVECRELVVTHLVSYKRLDKTIWFERPMGQECSRQMRVATIKKAIERLAIGTEPLDVIDCQALITIGKSISEDWKEISPELQERLIDVLRQQLAAAVQNHSDSAKLIQLPVLFNHHVAPIFSNEYHPALQYHPQFAVENVRTNHVILILNQISLPIVNLPNQLFERLRPQIEALHETTAKLNLADQALSNTSSNWKSTVDRSSRINELIWHTWYTQTGVLLGKPYDDLNNRPAKLMEEERGRKNRFVQPGDTLAIYIPGVLPLSGDPPVIQAGKGQPVTGFPVPVSKEGTIQLPYIEPMVVKDLELFQVLAAIEESYTNKHNLLNSKRGPLGITVQYLLRAGYSLELRNIAGSQAVTVPSKQ
jgi:hypothetical protein